MMNSFAIIYRLFTPLLAVVLMIVGVQLSSGLIKNSSKTQTALSVAYAGACPSGGYPAPSICKKPGRDRSKGETDGISCPTKAGPAGVIGGMCQGTCCMGTDWRSADQQAKGDTGANEGNSANSQNGSEAGSGGGGGMKALSGLMQGLMGMLKKEPKQPKQPDNRPPPPVCKSIAVSPTLPLRPGESATITWVLDGGKADTIIVSPGVGATQGFSARVSPRTSTTYTVTAKNERGSTRCKKVRVYVGPNENAKNGTITNTNRQNVGSDTVDVWSGEAQSGQSDNSNSKYDDVLGGSAPQTSQSAEQPVQASDASEDDEYYDFLQGVGSESTLNNDTPDYANYGTSGSDEFYYGDDVDVTFADGFDDFEGAAPSWDSVDVQDEGALDQSDINNFDLDNRADYYDGEYDEGNLAYYNNGKVNTNGLTNKEIYGVWSRAQTTTSGGASGGGFGGGSGASDAPVLNFDEPQESQGFFAKIGRWLKNAFCFWCHV